MEIEGTNFIGGARSAQGRDAFHAVDPSRGERLPPAFHEATEDEMDRALDLAARAFEDYRARRAEDRAAFLERAAEEILALGDILVRRATAETALPEARIVGERGRTVGQIRLFAALLREGSWVDARIDRADPARKPVPKPDVRSLLVPIGPVVVFGASNFPLAFSAAGGDSASALAAGNPVVVKSHPSHPGTSELVAGALTGAARETGMPAGVISMVQGARNETGLYLVRHPLARAVGFTGSYRGGKALFDAASARPEPIPVFAEMGSVNPVFLLPGALRERAEAIAEGLHASVTLGVGQFCTNPGIVVAQEGEGLEAFVAALSARIEATAPGTMLHGGISRAYSEGIEGARRVDGVKVLARSSAFVEGTTAQGAAALLAVDAGTFLRRAELSEEVFGPSTIVVRCRSRDEVEAVARGLRGQLTATIHAAAGEIEGWCWLVAVLREKAGRLVFNGFPTGVEVCAAMHHGGPFPATTDPRSTSVGTAAIRRFVRPVCFQDFPEEALPPELRNENARGIWRLVDGELTRGELP